jgi:hypothetical protein
MLLLGDRNFPSYRLMAPSRRNRSAPAVAGQGQRLLPRIATFTDGSWLAVLPLPGTRGRLGIWVRVIEYTITVTATTPHAATTTRVEVFRLITTITDPHLATAAQLADCHHQRWESEPSTSRSRPTNAAPARCCARRTPTLSPRSCTPT